MNAFIKNQKSLLKLRKDRRLLGINGSPKPTLVLPIRQFNQQNLTQHHKLLRFCEAKYTKRDVFSKNRWLLQREVFNYGIARNIYTTSHVWEKASSKIEETIKDIKKKEVEKEEKLQKEQKPVSEETEKIVAASSAATAKTSVPPPSTSPSQQLATVQTPDTQVIKKSIMQKIWAELVHYYHGFRLLFIDINVCRKLLWRILNGKTLTRREHKLLVRTTSDMFRLVPFSVFIIVPFMEFLLPVAIKLFPGMLPSTFQTASDRETKIKQNLKVKIEMAKFLQKTLDDMAVQSKDHRSEAAKDFTEFFQKIRTSGNMANGEEILKFSKLFEDEITLDSLNRQQLLALCRVLEASCIGTNAFLRFQLRMKLRSLAADDRVIQREGIDSLNLSELQSACRARGMRAYGISEERLKAQLQEWINLSLNEKVPPSLLLMSRALMLPENVATSDKLKATISALPDSIVTQTKAAIGEREGKIDNKTKIDVIKEEVRKIKEEREEQKEQEKELLAKEQQKQQEEVLVDQAPIITADGIVKPSPDDITTMLVEQQITQEQEKKTAEPVVAEVSELSSSDLKVVGDALGTLGKEKKTLMVEKKEIAEIREEIADYQEDVQELNEIVEMKKDEKIKESIAAKLLYRKVNQMINNLDNVLDQLEKKEQAIKADLLPAEPIAKSDSDLPEADPKLSAELVRIDELMDAIKKIQKVSDDSRLEQIHKILGRIDADQDGQLKVEDVLKVIETIGKENVKLTEKQIDEVIDLIGKEEHLETEDKIEKAILKSKEHKHVKISDVEEYEQELAEVEEQYLLRDKAKQLKVEDGCKTGNCEHEKEDTEMKISPELIKKVVDNQNEKILSKVAPIQPPPQIPTSSSSKPTAKTAAPSSSKEKMM